MRWIYAKIGEPMWEWTEGPTEQSVMFYEADRSRLYSDPPPMTDAECKRLEAALREPTRHPRNDRRRKSKARVSTRRDRR